MNKAELVQEIQETLGSDASKACAERALEAVLEAIKKGIKDDKGVALVGFGTFSVVDRAARTGVNPKTGAKIQIAASKAVKFKSGSGLKALVSC